METRQSFLDFARQLESSAADPIARAVTMTDSLVGAELGQSLRLCALPHEFDATILRVMMPQLSAEEARQRVETFAELSVVQSNSAAHAIHDSWRRELLRWWLRDEQRDTFAAASLALAGHFARERDASSGTQAEKALRQHMYHLLGADQGAGFTEFESLCRRARHDWRFAECAALIRLVHDYDDVLVPARRAALAYHEGKLAADLRNWAKAANVFSELATNPDADLAYRINAFVRLGNSQRNLGQTALAIISLERALQLATSPQGTEHRWRVLQELGDACREAGQLALAEKMLKGALLAAESSRSADLAGLQTSLGLLYRRQREPAAAVAALTKSLELLVASGDVFRPAQVYNNLGLARRDLREWLEAEAAFTESLKLKKKAGDLSGQANVLQNLGLVHAQQGHLTQAISAATEAARLFESQGDLRLAGVVNEALASYNERSGNGAVSRAHLEKARALFESAGDLSGVARVQAALAPARHWLPWWAWLFIAVTALLLVAGIVTVAMEGS